MLHAKPHIAGLPDSIHGGLSSTRLAGNVLDFSTCCNPYGPPSSVKKAVREANVAVYPDPDAATLTQAFSEKLGVPVGNLIVGNGSTEIIRLAAAAYLGHGDRVIIPSPTYGEYELACRIVNAEVVKFALPEENDFRLDAGQFAAFAKSHKPAAVFLCNPNNPTGQYLSYDEVSRVLRNFPDSLVVLDEAYIAFTDNAWDSRKLLNASNLLIVRSMTKEFAIAGLRLGYGIAPRHIIDMLKKVRPPWNVNSVAQKAGLSAVGCDDYLANCCSRISRCKLYLAGQLSRLGFRVIPTQTNFFIFRAGDAAAFKKRLLKKGFLVRDCTSFGLPEYVRVSPRSMHDCRKLIAAIREAG